MTAIQKLSDILEEYTNKFYKYSHADHIGKWLEQFPSNKQDLVINEITHIISNNFLSVEIEKGFLDGLISNELFCDFDIGNFWGNCSLLEIQEHGNSQRHMNEIFKNILFDKINIRIGINDFTKKNLIYIDDFMFSGYHLRCDINNILKKLQNNSKLKIVYLGWYLGGQHYMEGLLDKMLKSNSLNVKCQFYSYEPARHENRLTFKNNSDVFWPKKPIGNVKVMAYISNLEKATKKEIPFRDSNVQTIGGSGVFSSYQNRDEIEWIFLEKGIDIIAKSKCPSKSTKPLGFSSFDGLGFGGTFFSYRNIPNNTPICIWWGDPSATNSLASWYPLMQRKVYE